MKNVNRKRTVIEMCHDGVVCPKVIGPMLAISIDGVNVREEGFCNAYENPTAWYRKGGCPIKPVLVVKKKGITITGRASKKKIKK